MADEKFKPSARRAPFDKRQDPDYLPEAKDYYMLADMMMNDNQTREDRHDAAMRVAMWHMLGWLHEQDRLVKKARRTLKFLDNRDLSDYL